MKIKTGELSGVALDWAVAQVDEIKTIMLAPKKDEAKKPFALFGSLALPVGGEAENSYSPSTCWHCGGPLIERFELEITRYNEANWAAIKQWDYDFNDYYPEGETILIAACRAIVSSKLGDEVEIPGALL